MLARFKQGRLVALVAGAVLFSVPSALSAEDTYPSTHIGWWEIYGWDDDCWMTASFTDGTQFRYSWDARNNDSYLLLRNKRWTSIEKGKRYPIRLEIDGWSTSDTAGGFRDEFEPGVSFFVQEKDNFLAKLALGSRVAFFVNEKLLGSFSLKDSRKAVVELTRCAFTLRNRRVPDPFAGQ